MSETEAQPMPAAAPTRYSTAAMVLHWVLAALLLFQASLGGRMLGLAKGAGQFTAFQLHKSIGITILVLSLVRLAIRWLQPRPTQWPDGRISMMLAKAVHVLLYVVMIGGPLTGWILVSTAKIRMQTMLFGTVPWPHLPVGAAWHEPAEGLHALLATLFMALVLLHIAGALRHHVKREDLIGRMLPASVASHAAIGWAGAAAVLGLAGVFAWAKVMPFDPAPAAAVASATVASPAANPAASEGASASPSPSVSATETPSPDASASAAAVPWQLSPGGRLGFTADYSGSAINGSFKNWSAEIVFSPEDLAHSKIRVTVDLASVDTADGERDDMLRSDSFFNAAAHPRAVFASSSIKSRGPGKYAAVGTLTMHGASRPLTVLFDLTLAGDSASASGNAQLNRTSFGVGSGEWASTSDIRDGVAIAFRLKARRSQ